MANEPKTSEVKVTSLKVGNEIIEAETEEAEPKADESDFYTLEELEQ